MRFVFNEKKAAQAAACLLRLHGGRMNYMVLIKLLYLADRRSLVETGYPITGDCMVSMRHGPVLSAILDLVTMGEKESEACWREYISEPEGYDVALLKPSAETDELSRHEIGVLEETHKQFGAMDKWALVDMTHTLPEWQDPGRSSIAIDPRSILEAEGKTPQEIERLSHEIEETWFLSNLDRR